MDVTELSTVLAELKAVRIRPETAPTGGGHWRVTWQASPDKPSRTMTVAKTGSDWRGTLNVRAHVRRMLKADNITIPEVVKHTPKTSFDKAISVPTDTPTLLDMILAMRAELSELTALLLERVRPEILTDYGNIFEPAATTPEIAAAPEPVVEAPEKRKRTDRSIVVTVMTHRWQSVDDLMKAIREANGNLTRQQVLMKLIDLRKECDEIETKGERRQRVYRKKPVDMPGTMPETSQPNNGALAQWA